MSTLQTVASSLTMMDLHTASPRVFLNGTQIEGFTSISVINNATTQSVVIKFPELPQVLDLQNAGITVRREV